MTKNATTGLLLGYARVGTDVLGLTNQRAELHQNECQEEEEMPFFDTESGPSDDLPSPPYRTKNLGRLVTEGENKIFK